METNVTLNKLQYATLMRLWIAHKRTLAKHCTYYNEASTLESMSKVWNLYVMVKRDCMSYNLKQLYDLVKVNEKHLRNILPISTNKSYESSLVTLEKLLTIAKTYNQ